MQRSRSGSASTRARGSPSPAAIRDLGDELIPPVRGSGQLPTRRSQSGVRAPATRHDPEALDQGKIRRLGERQARPVSARTEDQAAQASPHDAPDLGRESDVLAWAWDPEGTPTALALARGRHPDPSPQSIAAGAPRAIGAMRGRRGDVVPLYGHRTASAAYLGVAGGKR